MSCETNVEDYEFLYVLSSGAFKNCYKVKHKRTSQEFLWKPINYGDMPQERKNELLAKVEGIVGRSDHPNIVKCYGNIVHRDTTTFYISVESCVETNLTALLERIKTADEYFSEAFIWRTVYQICCVNKIHNLSNEDLSCENIFLSSSYEVKFPQLLHFLIHLEEPESDYSNGNVPHFTSNLLRFIHTLCTLDQLDEKESDLLTIPGFYSDDLQKFVKFLNDVSPETNPDVILCHPTLLIKQSKYREPLSKVSSSKNSSNTDHITDSVPDNTNYRIRLENIRNREYAVKAKEEFLKEQERRLRKWERKIALQERIVTEKLQKAQLYLKRSKESRSSLLNRNKENLNESIDSNLVRTSAKLRIEEIPQPFKTADNRKVRFKGHSPRNSNKMLASSTTNSDGSCIVQSKKKCGLFRMASTKLDKAGVVQTCGRPASWTEESKREAFKLLRVMNKETDL